MNPWLILLALVVLAGLYVVAPVVAATLSHYRRSWRLRCPAEGADAQVTVDATRAALGEVLGWPSLEVKRCSLWPRVRFCKQECLDLPAHERRAVRPGAPAPGASRGARLRKILVPLDGSPGSESVLWTVGELARAQGARVRLVRVAPVVEAVRANDRVVAFADQESVRVEREETENLQRAVRDLEGIDVETAVRFGDPASEIVDDADAAGADLIAMATHRRRGLARVLKGSVAERVERDSTVPVILVPYGEEEPRQTTISTEA